MSFFHYSEFLMIALTNPRTVSLDSFILNHSVEYGVAAVASWIEFVIERWFCPGNPSQYSLINIVTNLWSFQLPAGAGIFLFTATAVLAVDPTQSSMH
jgi:hypothetical protein